MPPVKTLDEIDCDLRRVQAAVEGARAALRHSPNAENVQTLATLERLRDRILDTRYATQVADAVVDVST